MAMVKHEVEFDERLLANVKFVADGLGLTVSEMMTGIVVRWFAEMDAAKGAPDYHPRPLVEFAVVGDVSELYQLCRGVANERNRLEWERRAEQAAIGGEPLDPAQIAFIEKKRQIHAEHAAGIADRKDRWAAEQAAGRVPPDYKGSPAQAIRWLDDLDAGRITEAELSKRFKRASRSGWGEE